MFDRASAQPFPVSSHPAERLPAPEAAEEHGQDCFTEAHPEKYLAADRCLDCGLTVSATQIREMECTTVREGCKEENDGGEEQTLFSKQPRLLLYAPTYSLGLGLRRNLLMIGAR